VGGDGATGDEQLLGWAIVTALHDEGISRLDIPVVHLAVVVGLAGLAGVVAAVVPARRAAKLDILDAIVKQ
jgi:putative ABC transport system permease protein